jgi:hypothetical protein
LAGTVKLARQAELVGAAAPAVVALSSSVEGKLLAASTSDGVVHVFGVAVSGGTVSSTPVCRARSPFVTVEMAWSEDGRRLACVLSSGDVIVVNVLAGA